MCELNHDLLRPELAASSGRRIKHGSDARRMWRRRTPRSTPPRTRLPQRQRASSASVFPIDQPKTSNLSPGRKTAGSATVKVAYRLSDASASQNADLACVAAALAGMHHWARLGVIADNLVNMGRVMEKQAAP
jgi:hypothetical protein